MDRDDFADFASSAAPSSPKLRARSRHVRVAVVARLRPERAALGDARVRRLNRLEEVAQGVVPM